MFQKGCAVGVFLAVTLTSALFQADYNAEPPATSASTKLDEVQGQVNEVKVILKDNINKVLERGDRLDDLMDKTDGLQASVSTLEMPVPCTSTPQAAARH